MAPFLGLFSVPARDAPGTFMRREYPAPLSRRS